MNVRWINAAGKLEVKAASDLPSLVARDDGFLWVDLPEPLADDLAIIGEAFGFHEAALKDAAERSLVPRVVYNEERAFFILHTLDDEGHLLELDSWLGPNFLVTTHGPLTPGVPLELALRETEAVCRKLENGELDLPTVDHLAFEIIAGIEASLEDLLFRTAGKVGMLDRRAREGDTGAPEEFLEELFHVRHGLTTVRNRAAQSRQACHTLRVFEPSETGKALFEALEQRFDRLTTLCDGEREFTQGVLDFFESITNTRMNAAMNRLAIISFIVLPASAVIGFFGISSISYGETNLAHTLIFAALLLMLTLATLKWTKSKGWW
ncbi:MAG: CorA family divalent cation transporter [Actinomycetota bacterium]